VSHGDPENAFEELRKLAVGQEWNQPWYIKRIDLITPLEGFVPDVKAAPRGAYSLIAAVKARDEATLTAAFRVIEDRMSKFSHVDGFRAGGPTYDFNWP
jgi:hypothetical protein